MQFNYDKLLGRMKEKAVTQDEVARIIGSTPTTLSLKLNNKSIFKQNEISTICVALEIPFEEIGKYFFRQKV